MMVVNKKVIIFLSLFQLSLLGSVSVHATLSGEEEGPSSGISTHTQPSFSGMSPEEKEPPAIPPPVPPRLSIFFPGAGGEETFKAHPVTIGRDEISAMVEHAKMQALSSGIRQSHYLPVIPFDNSFWWGQSSTSITPQYLETMGDYGSLIGETGGGGALRMLGSAKFLYIVLEAMDDPHVKTLTGPQMDAKAEAAIAEFVFKRGCSPGAITQAELAAFGNDVKAQILRKSQPVASTSAAASTSDLRNTEKGYIQAIPAAKMRLMELKKSFVESFSKDKWGDVRSV